MTDAAMIGPARYERFANDAYFTPEWVTEALLTKVRFRGLVFEPACGDGAICRVLLRHDYEIEAADIHDYGFPCLVSNFLGDRFGPRPPFSICTNPPYNLAEDFVRHSLNLAEIGCGQVAMLLRHEWDCAASRRDLFERAPFAKKLTLTKRPRWTASDKASPRHNFAWFVWDYQHKGQPVLEWL